MKRLLVLIAALVSQNLFGATPPPERLLATADAIRNPQVDYTMAVRVTTYRPKKPADVSIYNAWIKGRDKAVVRTVQPAIDRGRLLLMNGLNFWGFLPNISKPMRISLQERLTGDVSNGDIARANFSGDYTVADAGAAVIGKTKCSVLDLKANSDDLTYGRVVLYLETKTSRPVKADFFAVSGRKLKTCSYENYKELGGAIRPTRLVMRDALVPDRYSVLEYADMTLAAIPDRYFSKDYMKKLAAE